MSFLKIKTDKASVAEFTGSSFINSTGIYDVTIKFASVATSRNGAISVNFNVDYNGNSQTIYGPYIQTTAGAQIESGVNTLYKLGVIAGLSQGDDLTTETEEHAVGKDNKLVDFEVIQEFTDLPVKMWIQMEYGINPNTNEISERKNIKGFFREDGATAEEITNETEVGVRLASVTEKYLDNITYKDDLTAEDVQSYLEAKKSKGKSAPKAKPAAAKSKAKISFGN